MSDFEKYLSKQLENVEFRKEWDDLEPEYNMIQALIDVRKRSNLFQKQLAKIQSREAIKFE